MGRNKTGFRRVLAILLCVMLVTGSTGFTTFAGDFTSMPDGSLFDTGEETITGEENITDEVFYSDIEEAAGEEVQADGQVTEGDPSVEEEYQEDVFAGAEEFSEDLTTVPQFSEQDEEPAEGQEEEPAEGQFEENAGEQAEEMTAMFSEGLTEETIEEPAVVIEEEAFDQAAGGQTDESDEDLLEAIESEAFDQSMTVNGVIVRVQAGPGVFPADAVLSVEQVPVYTRAYREADAAVDEVREEDVNVAVSYTFDIKVINPDTGKEYQPADGQTVNVSFALAEVADENLETQVYHVTEEETTGELTAEALDVTTEVTPETGEETTAVVETDGFSIYQVEFTYNKLEYVLPGNESVPVSKILTTFGLTGEVSAVEISDTSLFSASNETGEWIVMAHRAFNSTEWMKVTINGVVYEITVTDDNTGTITLNTAVLINSSNKSTYEGSTITGTVPSDQEKGIIADVHFDGGVVVDGIDLNLTIDGLNTDYSGRNGTVSGISLVNGATLHLTVKGENTLKAGFGGAGISVPAGCTLEITSESTGMLNAVGGRNYGGGAGIGSIGDGNNTQYYQLYPRSLGSIVINGGTINAQGGTWYNYYDAAAGAAGIGGSELGDGTGSITINGGTVTATGGGYAAGIGGGFSGTIQSITINGGRVTANGNNKSAAIGTGYNGYNDGAGTLTGPTIVINGGTVTANGNIGFGEALDASQNVGGSVTISGNADVTASNYSKKTIYANIYDERLTTGATLSNARLSLSNGLQSYGDITVARDGVGTASFRFYPEDTQFGTMTVRIESGTYTWEKNSANIPDSGDASIALQGQITGSITTYLDENGDAQTTSVFATPITPASDTIGAGWYAVTENVTVSERINVSGDVHLILCDNTTLTAEKGISVTGDNSLTIYAQSTGENMGALTATGPVYYAGIGGYLSFPDHYAYGDITINGGRITATTADSNDAGIGGAGAEESKTIVINGGSITATGGYGIGGSSYGGYAQTGGTIKLGWNNENTRIQVNGVYRGYCGTVTYQNPFVLQGTTVEPTSDNLNTHDTKYLNATLVPAATVAMGSIVGDGSIEVEGTLHEIGSTVTLTPVPAMGYKLDTLTVTKTGDSSTTITVSGENTFTMPAYDVTVSATFILNTDDFTPSSDGKVYTIQNAEGWDLFCYYSLQDDYSGFSGKTIKLAADISVSMMAGDYFHHFTGDFDGQGHTLTINYEPTEGVTAPFRYADGCTIQNLHVNGVITTSEACAAGIIASSHGNTTIRNCRSSVIIHSSYYDSSSYYAELAHGGLVSTVRRNGHLTIDGCVFDGKILTGATKATEYCGGYVSSNSGALTITNSLYDPAALNDGEKEATGNSNSFAGSGSITNSYYTRTLGTAQGKRARKIVAGENVTLSNARVATVYNTSGITSYGTGIEYDGVYYAGSEDSVRLNLNHSDQTGYTLTGYTASAGALTGDGNPYTLTMPDEDVTVSATFAEGFDVSIGTFTGGSVTGAGTYQIGSTVTLTAIPDPDYILTSIEATKTGDPSTSVTLSGTGNTRTFTAPAYDVTVTATFTLLDIYTINNAEEWNLFCDNLKQDDYNGFSGKYVKLTADISVSTMAGDSTHIFAGTFDGQGHTLTINYEPKKQSTAPFPFASGCTIQNLHVNGTITTSKMYATGIIASMNGNVTIRNCRSSVVIHSSIDGNGDGNHAGLVSIVGYDSNLTIDGCVFDGKILTEGGTATTRCGGFVAINNGAVDVINSLYAPATCSSGEKEATSKSYTFVKKNTPTITNSYYTRTLGTAQGKQARKIVAGENVTLSNARAATVYNTSGITSYGTGIEYGGVYYAGSEDSVRLNLNHSDRDGYTFTGYTASAGTLMGTENPYTLTMPDADVTVTATYHGVAAVPEFSPEAGSYVGTQSVTLSCATDGATIHYTTDGTEPTASSPTYSAAISVSSTTTIKAIAVKDDMTDSAVAEATYTIIPDPAHFEQTGENEYTIHTAEGWNLFCDALQDNDTYYRFSGKTVKLGANITVTRMAGYSGHDFCGTFDGNHKTLTLDISASSITTGYEYVGPFRYVSNVDGKPAVFKDLHVTGTITTGVKYAGGLIGACWGDVTIENCVSSVTINSSIGGDGTHGGFVAVSNGSPLTITGCVFDGKLLTTGATATKNCGGFVGWSTGTVNISDSLYAPVIGTGETEVSEGTAGDHPSATFVRDAVNTLSNCYTTRVLGTAQGKQPLTITAGEYVTVSAVSPIGNAKATYSVSGITSYANGITRGGTFYYGSGDDVSLTLTHSDRVGYTFASYAASAGTLSGTTLTMPDGDVTVSATFTLIPATAPTITTQPQNVSLDYGYTTGIALTVAVNDIDGHTLSYQWYSCGDAQKTNPQDIDNATSESYTIPTGQSTGTTGYYYCVVTATRSDNSQTAATASGVATVTVNPKTVTIPAAATGLKWTGSEQTGVAVGEGYTVMNGAATDVGDYTATATLTDTTNYKWSDDTTEAKTIAWSIGKADGPATPTGLAGVAPTTDGGSDGRITGVDTTMEYSADGTTYTACTGTEITGLTAGTYYVRIATTATHEASTAATVEVPAYVASYTIIFAAGYENPTGTMEPVTVDPGADYTLPASTAFTAPTNKTFSSWSVKIGDADPVSMQPDESFTVTADTTVTAVWEDAGTHVMIKGVTGSFNDKIKLNFYFAVPAGVTLPEGAYVSLTGGENNRTIKTKFCDTAIIEGLYKFSIPLVAKEASDTVTARVFDGNNQPITLLNSKGINYTENGFQFSLMQYFDWLASAGPGEDRAIGAAAKDYCIAAQIYFDYHVTEGMAVSSAVTSVQPSELERYKSKKEGNPGTVYPYGITAMIEADNALRIYLTGDFTGEHTYKIDNNSTSLKTRSKDGAQYLSLDEGVFSNHLQDEHIYTIDTYAYTASVMTCAYAMAGDTGNTKAQNLGKAMYLYNQAAVNRWPVSD